VAVLRFCRADARARQQTYMRMHTRSAAATAMQLPMRVYAHTGGPILTNGRQRMPCWARGWRRAAAIHPFTRHALSVSRYALRRAHRNSHLPYAVPGSPVACRIRSISESAACVLRTTGTVSTETSTTRLACLAPQRGRPDTRSPTEMLGSFLRRSAGGHLRFYANRHSEVTVCKNLTLQYLNLWSHTKVLEQLKRSRQRRWVSADDQSVEPIIEG
jgi:hypothetical protein